MLLSTSLRPHHLSRRCRRTLIGAASCRVAGQQTPNTNPADKLGVISLSVSLGSSKSHNSSASQANTARGSTVQAGGDVTIVASNTPLAQNTNTPTLPADITVQGSTINADGAANINTSTSRLNPAINRPHCSLITLISIAIQAGLTA